ncbi:MAG: ABC transporter permease [Bacteroidia bacterium]|jgi:lipopolysaccharide transport system permease protein|nr:ABC transporter permease [Bacteroidia bacterium]
MDKNSTSIIIKPSRGWRLIPIKELVQYQDLLYFLTLRGIKAKYAQSILGIGWAIIQPLFSAVVFTIIFGNLAQVDSAGLPYIIFSYLGMLPWLYFSNTLNEASNSLLANANMLSKVYFPRLVLPLSATFSKLLDFLIGLMVLIGLLFYYHIQPGIEILLFPLLLLILLSTSLGIGMLLASLSIQYRDVKHALAFIVQLLMYASPVVYSTTAVPAQFQFWYTLNPMVGVIENFRAIFTNTPVHWNWLWIALLMSVLMLICGALVFKRLEKTFADLA